MQLGDREVSSSRVNPAGRAGYLVIETRSDRPGLVRLYSAPAPPPSLTGGSPDPYGALTRYVASFPSCHIALMHAQTALGRRLVDIDSGLYRVDPVTAVAVVEAIELSHRRIHIDPEIAADPRLSAETARRHRRQAWTGWIWTTVGLLALLVLLLFSLVPVF